MALARACAAVTALILLSGCATAYLDSSVAELSPSEKVAVAHPQPVQLLFEFKTKGSFNGTATDLLKQTVVDTVQRSGDFSQISTDPVPNGALLHISIDNVPLSDDAFAKGFVTGFTFGLVGSTVGDGYICTADYQAAPNAPVVTKTMRDAIYTSMGATSGPQHAEKMASPKDAAFAMTERVVSHLVNDVANDPSLRR